MIRIAALAGLAVLAACADLEGYGEYGPSYGYQAPPPYWGPTYVPAPAPYWRPAWRGHGGPAYRNHGGGWGGHHAGRMAPPAPPRMARPMQGNPPASAFGPAGDPRNIFSKEQGAN